MLLTQFKSEIMPPNRARVEIEVERKERLLKRSKSFEPQRKEVNQLEDRALAQTLFEDGTLIHHGQAEQFIDIIRVNRNSLQNIDLESKAV